MNITNDKITEFINSYYRPLDSDLGALRDECENKGVPAILKETESCLSTMLQIIKPCNILEIGTAYGYSALFFARLLPDATITTIDRGMRMIPVASNNFKSREEGRRIKFRTGNAVDVLDELIEEKEQSDDSFKPYDFVFIDAAKSHYREFFDRAEKLCAPGAVIVCDNILMRAWIVDRSYEGGKRHRTNIKRMKEFLDYIDKREDISVSLLSSGDGLAVIKLHE